MSEQYAGDPSAFPIDFTLPDDGTAPKAQQFNVAFEALGDRTANLNARLTPIEGRWQCVDLVCQAWEQDDIDLSVSAGASTRTTDLLESTVPALFRDIVIVELVTSFYPQIDSNVGNDLQLAAKLRLSENALPATDVYAARKSFTFSRAFHYQYRGHGPESECTIKGRRTVASDGIVRLSARLDLTNAAGGDLVKPWLATALGNGATTFASMAIYRKIPLPPA